MLFLPRAREASGISYIGINYIGINYIGIDYTLLKKRRKAARSCRFHIDASEGGFSLTNSISSRRSDVIAEV
jgi:hypothetical protein